MYWGRTRDQWLHHQGGCHSHRLNSHSYDRASWPRILMESLCILLYTYTSINVHVVNVQQFKFNTVNGQSPKNQHGQRSNTKKSCLKFWPTVVAVTLCIIKGMNGIDLLWHRCYVSAVGTVSVEPVCVYVCVSIVATVHTGMSSGWHVNKILLSNVWQLSGHTTDYNWSYKAQQMELSNSRWWEMK